MGLLAGIAGQWDTGVISISSLHMELRAGADDADSAAKIADSIFSRSAGVKVSTLDIADATLNWGYSDHTRGAVENSNLRIQRTENAMKLTFRGGTFSQNWLRKLEIVEIVAACDREGITFEKAEFRRGQGSVIFTGMKVTGGERPAVTGTAKIRKLGLQDSLPAALTNFVEGSISGNFAVSGSTNTAEGVVFAGQVRLDGQDDIALRDSIYLLKALSMVDYVRTYRRVDFREGSFRMRTAGGGIELNDIDLKSGDDRSHSPASSWHGCRPRKKHGKPREAVRPRAIRTSHCRCTMATTSTAEPKEPREDDTDFYAAACGFGGKAGEGKFGRRWQSFAVRPTCC